MFYVTHMTLTSPHFTFVTSPHLMYDI